MSRETIASALVSAAREFASRPAFRFHRGGWQTIAYEDFLKAANGFALALKDAGVARGDRVSLMSENRHEWCAAYLGILLAGAVAVPVDARLTAMEVRNILADSGAKVAFCSLGTRQTVDEAAGSMEVKLLLIEEVSPSENTGIEPPDTEQGALVSLLYTSGTTGNPKGVMLSNKNFLADAEAVREAGVVTPTDNVLSILPLHHTYPFTCTFLLPLLLGASITYPVGIKGPEIKSAVLETRVTVLIAVPQLLELTRNRIFERLGALPAPAVRIVRMLLWILSKLRRGLDLNLMGLFFHPMGRQFRFFACGGARLDSKVMADLEALGLTVVEGYGLTETSPIVSFNPLDKRKPGSVGRAVKGAEFKILEPDKEGVGEISVRGPMVMQGYYNKPEETAAVLDAEGWFRTGDLGYLDGDGYLFLTGRVKEVIVLSSGKNIYPEEVERHYMQSPLIKELAVYDDGGKLRAVIVPDLIEAKQRGVANINETLRWEVHTLTGHLPPHMRIMGYTLRSEPLPRTPLGKLRRFMVQTEAGRQRPEEPQEEDRSLQESEAGRAVVERIRSLVGADVSVHASDNMELDLGLDSLTRVELLAALESRFGLQLPEDEMAGVHTVGELVEAVTGLRVSGDVQTAAGEDEDPLDSVLLGEPADEDKRGVGFRHSGAEWAATVAGVGAVKFMCKLFFSFSVEGRENLPEPPYIITPNHSSFLDGFLVGAGLPLKSFRHFFTLGIRKYFRGRAGRAFAQIAHVIPIDPEAHVNKALALSAYVLRHGEALLVFPEGGRSYDGGLMEFKKGVGILAVKMNVPVVPAYLEGAYDAWPRTRRFPRPRRITMRFGKSLRPGDVHVPGAPDPYQAFVDELRKRVEALSLR